MLRKIDPNLSIREFIDLYHRRLKAKIDLIPTQANGMLMCAEAVRWLKRMDASAPVEAAWDSCSRPMWLAWALVVFSDGKIATWWNDVDEKQDPRYLINARLAKLGIIEDKYSFNFDSTINMKQANLIRKHFNPFK